MASADPAVAHELHRWLLACTRRLWEERGAERGITVGVAGVTGDKCAACVLLIGTRAHTYNQRLNLGGRNSHSQPRPTPKTTGRAKCSKTQFTQKQMAPVG